MDPLADLRKWQKMIEDAPPRAYGIYARYDVPLGPVYRYWDTKGRLWLYINRFVIESLPKKQAEVGGLKVTMHEVDKWDALLGIPVYFEGPDIRLFPSSRLSRS